MSCEECQEWKDAAELWREDLNRMEVDLREANSKLSLLVNAFKAKNVNYCNGCYGTEKTHAILCPLRELEL